VGRGQTRKKNGKATKNGQSIFKQKKKKKKKMRWVRFNPDKTTIEVKKVLPA